MSPDSPSSGQVPSGQTDPGESAQAVERAVRNAAIFLRRGDISSAESECRAAADIAPNDPAVLELLGDILLARGDRAAARDSYKRATELSPGASSPETKYARLVLNLGEEEFEAKRRQELDARRSGAASNSGSTVVATLASMLWPGLGQWYNGETTKAIILAVVYGLIVLVLLATGDLVRLMTLFFGHRTAQHGQVAGEQISVAAGLLWGGAAMAWLYAVIDAPLRASQKAKPKDPYTEPDF